MGLLNCWLVHSWGRWSRPFERTFTLRQLGREVGKTAEWWQRRECHLCDRVQERKVRGSP